MKDEDAVQFIQVCFQHMHRKKLAAEGMKLQPMDEEPDWLRLIRFKPTHQAFKSLQNAYVDGRLYLTDCVKKGTNRLEEIRLDLKVETDKFDTMCNQFI